MSYVLFIIYALYMLHALKYKGEKAIKVLVVVCFFQNFALLVFSRFLTPTVFTMVALVKEAYVMLYIFHKILNNRKLNKKGSFCVLAIITIVIYWFVNGKGEFKGQLTSFRQLYLPFAFYLFGSVCGLGEKEFVNVMRFYVRVCLVAVCIGMMDLILDTRLWSALGIERYAALKGNVEHLAGGMYRSFYTYDFLGLRLRRMASVLVDPVIFGQLLALGLIISIFCKRIYSSKIRKNLGIMILGLGLLTTLAKGGIVIAIFSICILLGRVAKKKWLSYPLFAIGILSIGLFAIRSVGLGTSGSQHINGLITGVQSLVNNPLGNGIGSGGNMADTYGGFAYRSVAGDESYIGSLMVQMGVFGLGLNIYFWYRFFLSKKNNSIIGEYANVINTANAALFTTSFVNYTAISFSSCFIYIILGAVGTQVFKRRQNYNISFDQVQYRNKIVFRTNCNI